MVQTYPKMSNSYRVRLSLQEKYDVNFEPNYPTLTTISRVSVIAESISSKCGNLSEFQLKLWDVFQNQARILWISCETSELNGSFVQTLQFGTRESWIKNIHSSQNQNSSGHFIGIGNEHQSHWSNSNLWRRGWVMPLSCSAPDHWRSMNIR